MVPTAKMTDKIIVSVPINMGRVADLLCSAVDPGYEAIHYWGEVQGRVEPTSWTFDARPVYKTPEEAEANINVHYRHYYPFNKGGALIIRDNEDDGENYTLDFSAIEKGLSIMARDFPKHFGDFLDDNDDNDTADVFVQCCLFGDVIYG